MKNPKTLAALSFAALGILAFAGCSGKSPNSPTGSNSPTPTSSPTPTASFTPTLATPNANTAMTVTPNPTLDSHSSPTYTPSPPVTATPSALTPSPTPTPYGPSSWRLYAVLGHPGTAATNGSNGYFSNMEGIAIGNGFIAVSDSGSGDVQVFNNTGQYLYNIAPPGSATPVPWGLAMDSNDELYICDPGNAQVDGYYLGASGAVYDYTWSAQGGLSEPFGAKIDGQGNLVVADAANGAVYNLAWADDTVLAVSSGNPSNYSPDEVALDAQGNVYAGDFEAFDSSNLNLGRIVVYNPAYAYSQTVEGLSWTLSLNNPVYGLARDSQNNLFVSDTSNSRVVYMTTQGDYLGEIDGFDLPEYLALDHSDDLFVVDTGAEEVLEFAKN